MTKDEIDASGAPHSCIRLTSPPSKEVAPSAVELLQLADQQAYMRARYNEEDSGLIHESRVIEWALRQAATPAAGMREALEPFISKVQWPMYGLADTDVVQCNVVTPDYETGGIKRAFFGLLVSDFKRLAEADALRSVQPPAGEGVRDVANWMILHSYATGHGDTLEDLLSELVAQARPPSLVDREAVADALADKWPGDYSTRASSTKKLPNDRAFAMADFLLSIVNPQDKGVGCETMESQCNSIVPSGHVGVEYTASKGLSRVDCWVTREEGERIRNSSSVTIALSGTTAERGAGRASIIQECADVVGEMRQSEAGIFDAKHSGQRGEDRSNALYDAYQAIRKLKVSHP